MPLTKYGLREWLIITIVAAIAAGLCIWLLPWWTALFVLVVWVAVISFFRDPIRRVPTDLPEGAMLSPADGTISAIERVEEHHATDGPALVIRVLLTVLNVHVNRSPYDSAVVDVKYQKGQFVNAMIPESAAVNENNITTLRIATPGVDGATETIGVKQIAGKVARRIVCPLKPGDKLRRGQKWGMIKFGSTTELILPRPDDVETHVELKQFVRGGLTQLATLHPPGAKRG